MATIIYRISALNSGFFIFISRNLNRFFSCLLHHQKPINYFANSFRKGALSAHYIQLESFKESCGGQKGKRRVVHQGQKMRCLPEAKLRFCSRSNFITLELGPGFLFTRQILAYGEGRMRRTKFLRSFVFWQRKAPSDNQKQIKYLHLLQGKDTNRNTIYLP